MARKPSKAAAEALAATNWKALDAMTDSDIARQIASNRDAAPDMAPEIDVRAIRRSAGMTQAEFAAAYCFSVRARRQTPERSGADASARDQGRSRGRAVGVGRG